MTCGSDITKVTSFAGLTGRAVDEQLWFAKRSEASRGPFSSGSVSTGGSVDTTTVWRILIGPGRTSAVRKLRRSAEVAIRRELAIFSLLQFTTAFVRTDNGKPEDMASTMMQTGGPQS